MPPSLSAHRLNITEQPCVRDTSKKERLVPHDDTKNTYGVTVMHIKYKLKTSLIAITILFATLLPSPTTAQTQTLRTLPTNAQSVPINPANTQQVIQHFRTLKATDMPAWLHSTLSSATSHQSGNETFGRATWLSQLHIVQDETTCAHLKQQAAPVLKLFGRHETVQIFIYLDNYPNLQTIAGSYLGVSTGLIRLLKRDTADNAQLNGLVAHELARGIQQERFIAAWKNEDLQTIRAFELFYDAVATAALNHLRLPSQQYALILQRMIAHSSVNNTDRKRHPDLEQRQSLIRTIGLAQSPITQITTTLN